ncbi:MAG: hypothetical protein WB664_03315 [Nitrososphaeraceae archaeon]
MVTIVAGTKESAHLTNSVIPTISILVSSAVYEIDNFGLDLKGALVPQQSYKLPCEIQCPCTIRRFTRARANT